MTTVVPTGRLDYARAWKKANPQTPEEIDAFYRQSDALEGDLGEWHDSEARQAWTQSIVNMAKANGCETILDVGCGRGDDLKAFTEAGYEKTKLYAVEPNNQLAEALARDGFAVADDTNEAVRTLQFEIGEDATFDMVLCVDVLEHLANPQEMVDRLTAIVPVGKWLVESTATADVRNPSHLKSNWGWLPNGQIRKAGFALRVSSGRLNFWQRTAMSAPGTKTLICCAYRAIAPETVQTIHKLGLRGWGFLPHTNDALITRARSQALSHWWREAGDDACLMLDADITFDPEAADRILAICREKRSIVVGAYAVRDGDHLSSRITPGETVTFKADAEPQIIEHGATGFMAIHRDVVDAMIPELPLCHPDQPWNFWPFFDCEVLNPGTMFCEYLSEDWSFTTRARRLGFDIWLDPSVRLGHLGLYEYRLEDMSPQAKEARHLKLTNMEISERSRVPEFFEEGASDGT